jgi:Zn-finger nucleic acid-binding protein
MKCPKCGGALKEENFHGVLIDRCTGCGGVYLDKGELELLARAEQGGLKRLFGG